MSSEAHIAIDWFLTGNTSPWNGYSLSIEDGGIEIHSEKNRGSLIFAALLRGFEIKGKDIDFPGENGYGNGAGYGSGDGTGNGDGFGEGSGDGHGDGRGYGAGFGPGNGFGNGNGSGDGPVYGNGEGNGEGNGYGGD